MNRYWKILHKILRNQIQKYNNKIIYHNKVGFTHPCKDSSISANQCWYTTLKTWRIRKKMVISIDVEKAFHKIQHYFPVASDGKNLPAMREIWVQSLGQEDPLEKGMAIHSNILTWRIPRTEKPGGLQSVGPQRVRYDWVTNKTQHNTTTAFFYERKK